MRNVRDKNKTQLAAFTPQPHQEILRKIAAIERITLTELQVRFLERAVASRERNYRRKRAAGAAQVEVGAL